MPTPVPGEGILQVPFLRLLSLRRVGLLIQLVAFLLEALVAVTIIGAMGWFDRLAVWGYIPILLFSGAVWIMAFVWVYGPPSRELSPTTKLERRVRLAYSGVLMMAYFVVRWSVLVLEVSYGIQWLITIGVALDMIVVGLAVMVWGVMACVWVLPGECRRCCGSCSEELASLEA